MRQYALPILVLTVLAAGLAYSLSAGQQPVYAATARVLVTEPVQPDVISQETRRDPERFAQNQVERFTSEDVASRAAELMAGDVTSNGIQGRLTVRKVDGRDVIQLEARDPDPLVPVMVLEAVIESYRAITADEIESTTVSARNQLQDDLDQLQAQLSDLDAQIVARQLVLEAQFPVEDFRFQPPTARQEAINRAITQDQPTIALQRERGAVFDQIIERSRLLTQLQIDSSLASASLELLDAPSAEPDAVSPSPNRDAAIAGLVALLGASMLAWRRADARRVVSNSADVTALMGVPLLGRIARSRWPGRRGRIPTAYRPGTRASDGFHFVLSSLEVAVGQQPVVVQITSAVEGEGKSRTALNLAVAACRDGRRVTLVDADLRQRSLSRFAKADHSDSPGLVGMSLEDLTVREVARPLELPGADTLTFVPAGHIDGEPAGFFRRPAFLRALVAISQSADLIIIDSPPILPVSDGVALTLHVDGVVVVVGRQGRSGILTELMSRLRVVEAPVLGVVLNRARRTAEHQPRYSGYSTKASRGRRGAATDTLPPVVAGAAAVHGRNGQLGDAPTDDPQMPDDDHDSDVAGPAHAQQDFSGSGQDQDEEDLRRVSSGTGSGSSAHEA